MGLLPLSANRSPVSPPQKHERALIPAGMVAILPRTAQRVRNLEYALMACLGRWGYEEIIPPTFEYLDVLSAGLEAGVIEKCYTLSDRTTGRILMLRPDVTAQIARIVGMGMLGSHLPLRLSYRTTVFRYEPDHAGREREIFQIGAELIGEDDVATDGEIIVLMVDCLRTLGLTEFKISVGHVGFFRALLAQSGLLPEAQKRAEQAAARKDLPRLKEILSAERVPASKAHAILEAPGLYGHEEVLARGKRLAGKNRLARAAVGRLEQIYELLVAAGVRTHLLLDLGEFRGFDYYDGVVFDVFADGLGCELGGGGRYNHLIGRFGRDVPSTGFAFDVDRLFRAMEGVSNGATSGNLDVVIGASPDHAALLFQVGQMLRSRGFRVIQKPITGSPAASLAALAAHGQELRAPVVALLDGVALDRKEVLLLHLSGGKESEAGRKKSGLGKPQKVKLDDLPIALKT